MPGQRPSGSPEWRCPITEIRVTKGGWVKDIRRPDTDASPQTPVACLPRELNQAGVSEARRGLASATTRPGLCEEKPAWRLSAIQPTMSPPHRGLVLYQVSVTGTHGDGFPWFSARRGRCRDAVHRKSCATTSEGLGKPPFRSLPRAAGERRKASTIRCIARGFPLTQRSAETISMGFCHRNLVIVACR